MRKPLPFRQVFWIAFVCGWVIVSFTFAFTTHVCESRAVRNIDREIRYLKDQCARYDDAAAESETKSLIRIADKVMELRRDSFFAGAGAATEDDLKEFVENQRLTGAIVTDEAAGTSIRYVGVEDAIYDGWQSVLSYVGGVETSLNRCCTERFAPNNGYCYDYAAVGRADKKGIILCWLRQEETAVAGAMSSIRTTLAGYGDPYNVLVAVTDGNNVVASNEDAYIGLRADECVFTAELNKPYGNLSRVRKDGLRYYGMSAKAKSYYLYVYYAGIDVYSIRYAAVIVVLLVMATIFMVFTVMRYRGEQMRVAAEKERDAAYSAALADAADRATRANNAKTEFLRRMSHDLLTPINGIRGLLEMTEYYQADEYGEKRRELRAKTGKTVDYLLELVNNILEMSKYDVDGMEIEQKDFDISDVLDSVCSVMKALAADHGVSLVFAADVEHTLLRGGSVELRRALFNLVGNAIKYNREGGKVTVGCKETGFDGERAIFEFIVADTGIGMSPEFQMRMYEPFLQENPDDSRSQSGVGLGLAIVKKFVDETGGKIDVKSEAGKGTTFTMSLSFSVRAESSDSLPAAEESQGEPLKGRTILVAEDNELNMEIARFVLENAGAKVVGTTDGRAAVNAFFASGAGSIDAILMDVMMPSVDGTEATKEIRASGRADAADVPIVAMTANAFPDDVKNVLDAGMNAHHPKPIDSVKLVRLIAGLIEEREERKKRN